MAERGQLQLDDAALGDLAELLHQRDSQSGYLDPASGEIWHSFDGEVLGSDGEPMDLDEVDWVPLGGDVPSHESFVDMERFAAAVPGARLRERLERVLAGPQPFRRFRDAMYRAPEDLGRGWSRYRYLGMESRALAWLDGAGLASPSWVESATARRSAEARAILDALTGDGGTPV